MPFELINSTSEHQATSIKSTDAIKDRLPVSLGKNLDENSLSTCRSSTTGAYDMSARSDISDPSTSKFLKCNVDGTLELTAELDGSGLAKEETLSALNTKTTICNTGAIVGSVSVSSLPAITGSVAVSGGTIAVTSASLAKEATLSALNTKTTICNTGAIVGSVSVSSLPAITGSVAVSGGTIAVTSASLATDANLTNGNQVSRCMGLSGTSQVQLKVDAAGVLETSGGGGGGGSSQQYDSASTLPTPTIGTAVLGVDSGGLANVISTDNTGKIENVTHATNYAGVAFPLQCNQYLRSLYVNAIPSRSSMPDQTVTIPAGTTGTVGTSIVSMSTTRNICIYGNTTNKTDPIHLYCLKASYLPLERYKMPPEYDIIPDTVSGDFFRQLENTSIPYLNWGKDNTTLAAETILLKFAYSY